MADGPPQAQILGGRAAVPLVNALMTTRSIFRAPLDSRKLSDFGSAMWLRFASLLGNFTGNLLQKATPKAFASRRRERRSNFQPQKNLLATFVSFCRTESGGALSMAQSTMASQSSALHHQAINYRSTLLSFIGHSSLPAVAGHLFFISVYSCPFVVSETPKIKK
jgi:hypothetical protein